VCPHVLMEGELSLHDLGQVTTCTDVGCLPATTFNNIAYDARSLILFM